MYIHSVDDETKIIELAIKDAKRARSKYLRTQVLKVIARTKIWLVKSLDTHKAKDGAAPSSNMQPML